MNINRCPASLKARAIANMSTGSLAEVLAEEAKSIFYDEYAIQFYDEESSEVEDRFLMVGVSKQSRVLLVCHCERDDGETIRIISARKATNTERSYHEGNLS